MALAILLSAAAGAEPPRRYSGRVEAVDLMEGRVVVEELAERGRKRLHEVYVEADTPIVSATRVPPWRRGARREAEVPVSLVDVLVGDFVVVESADDDGGRPTARQITIIDLLERVDGGR